MNDELNKKIEETSSAPEEMPKYDELKTINDNVIVDNSIPGDNDPFVTTDNSSKKKKDTGLITKISGAFMLTVAATTLVLPAVVEKTPDIEISFHDTVVTDTTISYGVTVSDPSKASLSIKLKNDFTNRVIPIDDTVTKGIIEGLAPDMKYSLEIVMPGSFGSENILKKMEVKTLSISDYRTARFIGVDAKCTCNEDRHFHFTMNYVDNLGVYQNFVAYLEDKTGNRSECEFNDDLHSEQLINVSDSKLTGSTATLYITCDKVLDGISEPITLYQAEYSI